MYPVSCFGMSGSLYRSSKKGWKASGVDGLGIASHGMGGCGVLPIDWTRACSKPTRPSLFIASIFGATFPNLKPKGLFEPKP